MIRLTALVCTGVPGGSRAGKDVQYVTSRGVNSDHVEQQSLGARTRSLLAGFTSGFVVVLLGGGLPACTNDEPRFRNAEPGGAGGAGGTEGSGGSWGRNNLDGAGGDFGSGSSRSGTAQEGTRVSATCGDGVRHVGEACDDGNGNSDVNSDACRTDCSLPQCGDGVIDVELDEQCDDGAGNSDTAADGCSTRCRQGCGNGVVDSDETCDDGADNSDARPGACRTSCEAAGCGDGVMDTTLGETCDEGNNNSDTTPGACRTTCRRAKCGDGVRDLNEGCDAGEDNGGPDSPCNEACRLTTCGNGRLDAGEDCDDGEDNSDTVEGACRTTCRRGACGDGIEDAGEECDDGPDNSDTRPDACRTTCRRSSCGDGVTDETEECDGGDGCTAECKSLACGNGRMDAGEDCDPPDGDTCDDECRSVRCGDGIVNGDEECEPTGDPADPCTSECRESVCGDGQVEGAEQCEPDEDPNCSELCKRPVCGDGSTDGDEVCDDGKNDGSYGGCMPGCSARGPFCGDGKSQAPEQCDDGTAQNTGAYGKCSADCTKGPHCGDGQTQQSEQCDDGQAQNTGGYGKCNGNCTKGPFCGDGKTDSGEACDEGEAVNGQMGHCSRDCKSTASTCGDGTVNGDDECDDGKNDGSYGTCNPNCTLASRCGDGKTDPDHEACDDGAGNDDDKYDGCTKSCQLGPRCGDGSVDAAQEQCDDDSPGCGADCQCNDGFAICDDGCVDPLTDEEHCGAALSCSGAEVGYSCSDQSMTCRGGYCGDPSWTPLPGPQLVDIKTNNVTVGVDEQARAVAVWRQRNETGADQVYANTSDGGLNWGSPQQIASVDTSDLVLTVAAGGKALAAWEAAEVGVGYYTGSSWVTTATNPGRRPTVGITDSGGGVVVYESDPTLKGFVVAATGKPASEETLTFGDGGRYPSLSLGGGGKGALAWEAPINGQSTILVSYFDTVSELWGRSPAVPSTAGATHTRPLVAWRGPNSNDLVVVWRRDGGLVGRSLSNVGWSDLVELAATTNDVKLARAKNGDVFIVWRSQNQPYVCRFSGGQFGAVTRLNTDGDGLEPAVAVDALGRAYAVWAETFQGESRIWLRAYDNGWASPIVLPSLHPENSQPEVGVAGTVKPMVVWVQTSGSGSARP